MKMERGRATAEWNMTLGCYLIRLGGKLMGRAWTGGEARRELKRLVPETAAEGLARLMAERGER